jgi:hypothetical protein
VEGGAHLRRHAASHHGRPEGERDVGEAGLSEPNRALQPLLEDRGVSGIVRDLSIRAVSGVDVYFAGSVPQREEVRCAVHGFDNNPVRMRWVFWLQDCLSGGAEFPDQLRQAVSADDHDQRIHPTVSQHYPRHGADF